MVEQDVRDGEGLVAFIGVDKSTDWSVWEYCSTQIALFAPSNVLAMLVDYP